MARVRQKVHPGNSFRVVPGPEKRQASTASRGECALPGTDLACLELHGLLGERYGYSEEKAQAEIDRFYEAHVHDDRGQESALRRRSA